MIKLSLKLPGNIRFKVSLKTNRRAPQLKNAKNGKASVSGFFRYIFEHKNVRRILGTNLAVMVLASSLFPTKAFDESAPDEAVISENVIPLTTERVIQYPVEKVRITQGYRFFHPGIDFDGIKGDPIRPIKDGVIEAISRSKYAHGNAILVNHGGEITSLYAHLNKILVTEGEEVTTNTVIGTMGATGRASGDHLHLEVRDEGRPINPLTILPK